MPIAITPDQQAVQASLRDWAKQAAPLAAVRRQELGATAQTPYLTDLAALGVFSIAVPEDAGGARRQLPAPVRKPSPYQGIAAWAIPAIQAHGTPAQRDRFADPAITWCQLFSEPEAGSDLAGLRTRAERTDGGWRLTGQKVWTSLARQADWAIGLARTDPDVPKHDGLTYFLVDMHAPGIDIRPLREITGRQMFNEVFLDDVFVPDACVLGAPGRAQPAAVHRYRLHAAPAGQPAGRLGVVVGVARHPRQPQRGPGQHQVEHGRAMLEERLPQPGRHVGARHVGQVGAGLIRRVRHPGGPQHRVARGPDPAPRPRRRPAERPGLLDHHDA